MDHSLGAKNLIRIASGYSLVEWGKVGVKIIEIFLYHLSNRAVSFILHEAYKGIETRCEKEGVCDSRSTARRMERGKTRPWQASDTSTTSCQASVISSNEISIGDIRCVMIEQARGTPRAPQNNALSSPCHHLSSILRLNRMLSKQQWLATSAIPAQPNVLFLALIDACSFMSAPGWPLFLLSFLQRSTVSFQNTCFLA